MNKFIVSPSPHVHGGDSIERNMYGVLVALLPALLCSILFFGWGALYVTIAAVASTMFFEYIIQKYLLKQPVTIEDGSAIITGVLLAFNLPSTIPLWLVVLGALVAIGIGKMSFGGIGNNIFNPALVGRVFLLISFPVQMTTWPVPNGFETTDAVTAPTPLLLVKQALRTQKPFAEVFSPGEGGHSLLELGTGSGVGGSLGEISAFALLLGFAYLLLKRVITWHVPVSIFLTIALFSGILHWINPAYAGPLFHLLSGGVMLGAIFMATDYVTSPMSRRGMWIYGAGIGTLTIVIRNFGAYPEGVSFAILIMNAFTPLINRYCKPKRFA
ncbi:MAG: RnfABCDGE type electron transport complex subunit D [Odoribacteraceae bacterium]|jgi:electron transport complex protein RnfD|nr:RnfABCDGE type electron transport complex subunit D [Odoribacteraceae bacterium]